MNHLHFRQNLYLSHPSRQIFNDAPKVTGDPLLGEWTARVSRRNIFSKTGDSTASPNNLDTLKALVLMRKAAISYASISL